MLEQPIVVKKATNHTEGTVWLFYNYSTSKFLANL